MDSNLSFHNQKDSYLQIDKEEKQKSDKIQRISVVERSNFPHLQGNNGQLQQDNEKSLDNINNKKSENSGTGKEQDDTNKSSNRTTRAIYRPNFKENNINSILMDSGLQSLHSSIEPKRVEFRCAKKVNLDEDRQYLYSSNNTKISIAPSKASNIQDLSMIYDKNQGTESQREKVNLSSWKYSSEQEAHLLKNVDIAQIEQISEGYDKIINIKNVKSEPNFKPIFLKKTGEDPQNNTNKNFILIQSQLDQIKPTTTKANSKITSFINSSTFSNANDSLGPQNNERPTSLIQEKSSLYQQNIKPKVKRKLFLDEKNNLQFEKPQQNYQVGISDRSPQVSKNMVYSQNTTALIKDQSQDIDRSISIISQKNESSSRDGSRRVSIIRREIKPTKTSHQTIDLQLRLEDQKLNNFEISNSSNHESLMKNLQREEIKEPQKRRGNEGDLAVTTSFTKDKNYMRRVVPHPFDKFRKSFGDNSYISKDRILRLSKNNKKGQIVGIKKQFEEILGNNSDKKTLALRIDQSRRKSSHNNTSSLLKQSIHSEKRNPNPLMTKNQDIFRIEKPSLIQIGNPIQTSVDNNKSARRVAMTPSQGKLSLQTRDARSQSLQRKPSLHSNYISSIRQDNTDLIKNRRNQQILNEYQSKRVQNKLSGQHTDQLNSYINMNSNPIVQQDLKKNSSNINSNIIGNTTLIVNKNDPSKNSNPEYYSRKLRNMKVRNKADRSNIHNIQQVRSTSNYTPSDKTWGNSTGGQRQQNNIGSRKAKPSLTSSNVATSTPKNDHLNLLKYQLYSSHTSTSTRQRLKDKYLNNGSNSKFSSNQNNGVLNQNNNISDLRQKYLNLKQKIENSSFSYTKHDPSKNRGISEQPNKQTQFQSPVPIHLRNQVFSRQAKLKGKNVIPERRTSPISINPQFTASPQLNNQILQMKRQRTNNRKLQQGNGFTSRSTSRNTNSRHLNYIQNNNISSVNHAPFRNSKIRQPSQPFYESRTSNIISSKRKLEFEPNLAGSWNPEMIQNGFNSYKNRNLAGSQIINPLKMDSQSRGRSPIAYKELNHSNVRPSQRMRDFQKIIDGNKRNSPYKNGFKSQIHQKPSWNRSQNSIQEAHPFRRGQNTNSSVREGSNNSFKKKYLKLKNSRRNGSKDTKEYLYSSNPRT